MTSAHEKLLRDVFLGFMRVHVLHHAAEGPIFGVEMMEELRSHGYDISPGTLYPLLHALEQSRLLGSQWKVVEGKNRKYYRTTRAGNKVLARLRILVAELSGEVLKV